MRIACVHVPQIALQSLGRSAPSLRGAAVAVVGAGAEPAPGTRRSLALHSPIVVACSRAAWTLGVRLGMTASATRFLSSEIEVVMADAQGEHETVRAIADALLGVSAVVDVGGRVAGSGAHLAMYCEVPSKTRGQAFGERLLALLDRMGITARIGIADDRFTAWVAAAHGGVEVGGGGDGATARQGGGRRGAGAPRQGGEGRREAAGAPQEGVSLWAATNALREMAEAARPVAPREDRGVVSVPRGGSPAFLAPRPLSLLAISPEVQHMLESLGVRTLGEFAALPAPSVARPLEADYQALARGESGSALRPYAPQAAIREELAVGGADSLFGNAAAVTALAERLALRLAGRARSAARLEIATTGDAGERVIWVTAGGASSQAELIEVLAAAVGEGPIARLRVVVAGEAIAGGASGAEGDITEPLIDALSAVLSSAGTAMPLLAPLGHLAPLALPGRSQPWQLSTPHALRSERRDAHRRTRRARQRPGAAAIAQSQLFGQFEK